MLPGPENDPEMTSKCCIVFWRFSFFLRVSMPIASKWPQSAKSTPELPCQINQNTLTGLFYKTTQHITGQTSRLNRSVPRRKSVPQFLQMSWKSKYFCYKTKIWTQNTNREIHGVQRWPAAGVSIYVFAAPPKGATAWWNPMRFFLLICRICIFQQPRPCRRPLPKASPSPHPRRGQRRDETRC